jgi:hypothetical protein
MESAGHTNVKVAFRSGLLESPPLEKGRDGGLQATDPLTALGRAQASVEPMSGVHMNSLIVLLSERSDDRSRR